MLQSSSAVPYFYFSVRNCSQQLHRIGSFDDHYKPGCRYRFENMTVTFATRFISFGRPASWNI